MNVRFTPESGQMADISGCPLCAKSGHSHCSKKHRYSIASSASAIKVGGMSSAMPLLRLNRRLWAAPPAHRLALCPQNFVHVVRSVFEVPADIQAVRHQS